MVDQEQEFTAEGRSVSAAEGLSGGVRGSGGGQAADVDSC